MLWIIGFDTGSAGRALSDSYLFEQVVHHSLNPSQETLELRTSTEYRHSCIQSIALYDCRACRSVPER